MIGLGDRRSGHDAHPCEENSRDDEVKESVHFVGEVTARDDCPVCHENHECLVRHEDGHGQSQIATTPTEASEPTE